MPRPPIRLTPSFFLPATAGAGGGVWQPATDVYRTRDGWLVKFDLAGVRPEDIRVTVSGRELTVVGVRRDFCLDEGCCHYTMEITYSRFERAVTLPEEIQSCPIAMEHQDGMLLVRILGEATGR